VAAMLLEAGTEAGSLAAALLDAEACWIAASVDGAVAGLAGIETIVDAAAIGALFVIPAMRRRGIGSKLACAARKAAHTRGAKRLYAPVPRGEKYLKRFGFEPTELAEVIESLAGTRLGDYMRAHQEELAALEMLRLDISRDGIIER
jgi:N-acetylglutamate synthase-like GNAT family acetyltransferase